MRLRVLLEKSGSEVHRLRGLLGDMERQASEMVAPQVLHEAENGIAVLRKEVRAC